MISDELRSRMRRLFYAEHWKVGTIAAELGVHHDTVSLAIEAPRFVNPVLFTCLKVNGRVVAVFLDGTVHISSRASLGAGEARPAIHGCPPHVGTPDPLPTLWDQSPTVVPYDDGEDDISLCGIIALYHRAKEETRLIRA
jgi:hypothetical protein